MSNGRMSYEEWTQGNNTVLGHSRGLTPNEHAFVGVDVVARNSYSSNGFNRVLNTGMTRSEPPPQPTPSQAELMKPEALAKLKGDLLLKLLEIEGIRCKGKLSEEERSESLAMLLEGEDHVVDRISKGIDKYLALIGAAPQGIPTAASPWVSDEEMSILKALRKGAHDLGGNLSFFAVESLRSEEDPSRYHGPSLNLRLTRIRG